MTEIIIHRGAHTIGGSCVEINSKGYRILLDLGAPLMASGGGDLNERDLEKPSIENGILPDIKGLYKNDTPQIRAVFISHAHIDHYGLLDHIHPNIPVYVSEGTHALIKIGRVFYPGKNKIYFDTYEIFKHWIPVHLGPYEITSYLVDHSGYDASSFLIEVDNKRIFYSGDFRGHGRKSKLLKNIVKNQIAKIDCLLMEGTTLGGGHNVGFQNEEEVEIAFYDLFSKQEDVSFIGAAGSNIDRLVSLYKATRKSNKILVLDLYTFYVLDQLKKITPGLPPFEGDNIRIFYLPGHAQNIADHLDRRILYKNKFIKRKIELNEIIDCRKKMVLKLPISGMKKITNALVTKNPFNDVKYIFSMWPGYLKKDAYHQDFCNAYNVELVKVHVSGHAYLNDLKKLAEALQPKKIIPIHTLNSDIYSKHFENVLEIEDGVVINI